MKQLNKATPSDRGNGLKLKYLVIVMASVISIPVAQADVAKKQIGDLEIYKAAEGGKVIITMMLDTSGSMDAGYSTSACDLPPGVSSQGVETELSATVPQYTRRYCKTQSSTSSNRTYFYRYQASSDKWYRCGAADGSGSSTYGSSVCNAKSDGPSSIYDFQYISTNNQNVYYAYKESKDYIKEYDRLTRLKDAIFTLMDSNKLDADKVKIGIGQFSTQSNSSNSYKYPDGRSGKILVPAALLDQTQKNAIKTAVAGLIGRNGTPTANAYAEAGAYMLGTNTLYSSSSTYSGFDDSVSSSKTNGNYISPLSSSSSTATCDGRGIYFLTDGNPNSAPNPKALMDVALGAKGATFSIPSDTLPSGSENNNGMPQVGAFARALRNPAQNPLNLDILTAVVGFGSVFDVDRDADADKPEKDRVIRKLSYVDSKGTQKTREFYNCEKISNKDAKNACNWGEKSHPSLPNVGGFGEGGFYSAQSTDDVVTSITTFVSDLNQTLPSTPSGTISVPDDPYRPDSQLAFAYYPILQPKVADNAVIWEGNMKKYSLNEGTLYGKDNNKLFKNIAGELNKNTQDLWSDKDYVGANDKVESGGFYAQLNTPDTGVESVRTLYVEDFSASNDQRPVLRKVSVNSNGKFTLDGTILSDTNNFKDTATYSEAVLRKLLNFLGFDVLDTSKKVSEMTLSIENASGPIKVVGATLHSKPASVSYSAELDSEGRVTDNRDDYVLFGSSEGGLHLVNTDNYSNANDGGKEKFVIIPREMLKNPSKSDALIKNQKKGAIGIPNFGIDAPWLVDADYKYNINASRVTVGGGVFAYGGLRMGGEAFYGVDITDSNAPGMMFTITPSTSGFSRMGQIWSKPTKAKIKTTTSDTDEGTDVLIFGGGYDMCYENEDFQVGVTDVELGACSNKSSAKGNAVYIINAKTGALIWSASGDSGATKTVTAMKNSVVAGITTLDRNNDGYMDHIYFADLGGQIFRADFTNAGFVKPVASGKSSPESSFSNVGVTRILKNTYTSNDERKYAYRFYERPVVSFYSNPKTNSLFALVNAISGDRSSPLSKMRDSTNHANRLYGIIDNAVTQPNNRFYTGGSNSIVDLTDSSLAQLPIAMGVASSAGYSNGQKDKTISEMQSTTTQSAQYQGWYYPLTRFDGYDNVRYTKGIGKSEVIDSFLYTTVYNPDMSYGATDSCTAQIVGGSERQLYCLPYGICRESRSKNGTAGFVRAGKGIQELTLGPRSSKLSNQKLLIGTQTLNERAENRVEFGLTGDKSTYSQIDDAQNLTQTDQILSDGSAPALIHKERFTLQPRTWYEVE